MAEVKRRNQWVISKVFLEFMSDEVGTRSAGTTLPKLKGTGKTTKEIATLARAEGMTQRFRMLDDDGQVYYEGYMVPFEDHDDNSDGFEPLDDFGMPNSGCTELQYWDKTGWTTL